MSARLLLIHLLPALLLLSCGPGFQYNLSHEECACLDTVPDSCFVDTLGIVGAIFPKNYSYPSPDSSIIPPTSTWTPKHREILKAERVFQAEAAGAYSCLDSNVNKFYRQYIGLGSGTIILIHGIRKSRDIFLCGHRSFWINVYDSECSTFDAEVELISKSCSIVINTDH